MEACRQAGGTFTSQPQLFAKSTQIFINPNVHDKGHCPCTYTQNTSNNINKLLFWAFDSQNTEDKNETGLY